MRINLIRSACSCLALLQIGAFYFCNLTAEDLESIQRLVRERFPEVRQLNTSHLEKWLEDDKRTKPLIVDVRPPHEFEVGHLKDARRLDSVIAFERAKVDRATPLVLYCSVGYRSSSLVMELKKAGWTNIWNVEGSIFKWANEGRPVYRGKNKVNVVHPYDAKWGKLLKAQYHPFNLKTGMTPDKSSEGPGDKAIPNHSPDP